MLRLKTLVAGLFASLLFASSSTAQELPRNEVSVQGTGFLTKDSEGNGIRQHTTDSGGLLASYRFHFNSWLAATTPASGRPSTIATTRARRSAAIFRVILNGVGSTALFIGALILHCRPACERSSSSSVLRPRLHHLESDQPPPLSADMRLLPEKWISAQSECLATRTSDMER